MTSLLLVANHLRTQYLPLIKGRQTVLLALTGVAGYLSHQPPAADWQRLAGLAGSLLAAISGCTVLNMVIDRDIDHRMARTRRRPLAAGQVGVQAAAAVGGILLAAGLGWALALSRLYFALVLAGAVGDVLVYSLWLKRRTAWSILWGGLAGGMPVLAGRALAAGQIDAVGLCLALSIVFWIPSHNLTLGMLYAEDYLRAGVPVFPNVYGPTGTYAAVVVSDLLTAALTATAFVYLDFPPALLSLLIAGSAGLVGLAIFAWTHPGRQAVAALYKYSSVYMLVITALLALTGWIAGR